MAQILNKVKKAGKILREDGVRVLAFKINHKVKEKLKRKSYDLWIKENEADTYETEQLVYTPKISVIIPVYNVESEQLEACIQSVLEQNYSNWELCISDDASTWESVRLCLKKYENCNGVKITYREKNGHISLNTNTAIEMATGEYVALLDCDDLLAPNALYEVAKLINVDQKLDYIYSDEDKIDEKGKRRHQPHFKPDWSPDTFMSLMYTCHLSVFRKSLGDELGWMRQGYEGAQDYDFVLRFTEKTTHIGHIPKVLYHWRERKESTALNVGTKSYIVEATEKAKKDALSRRGIKAELEWLEEINQYRMNYQPPEDALVSIIIPSKDNSAIARQCIESLVKKTAYKNYEVILVDNGSKEQEKKQYKFLCQEYDATYIYEKMDFNFSRMCNIGAEHAKGDFLLFLNDDITILNDIWLERMLGHAALEHIGAVGAKLLYPGGNIIQHIGVHSLPIGPVHTYGLFEDSVVYPFCRNRIEYNYSAVTAACLMVGKKKFEQVGGFDESFAVAYNDVDLCFQLVEQGYYNVARMDAVLCHHESLSRGNDEQDMEKLMRLCDERERLYKKHPVFKLGDPFYNENLSIHKADCSVECGVTESECIRVTESAEHEIISSSEMNYGVLLFSQNRRYVFFNGWCVDKKSKGNKKITVVMKGTKKTYYFRTEKAYLPALRQIKKQKSGVGLCCFTSAIRKEVLENQEYHIYLWDGEKYVNTHKTLEIKD